MSRLVSPATSQAGAAIAQGDEYKDRVAKYVPTEVVAAYTALLGILASAPTGRTLLYSAMAFIVCLLATPVYIAVLAGGLNRAKVHAGVSTVAFVVWAFAIGGDHGIFGATGLGWYEPALASGLLVVFTLVSGVPRP